MEHRPLAGRQISIALCNGVRGLKLPRVRCVRSDHQIALCNGVRGLK